MKYDPQKHHRRSIRLKDHDYARAGAYFVTIITLGRACLLGEITGGEMRLNRLGRVVDDCWRGIPKHFMNVELGTYVIIPNHFHGIIQIIDAARSGGAGGPRPATRPPPRITNPDGDNPSKIWAGKPRPNVNRRWD